MSLTVETKFGTCTPVGRPSYGHRKHGVPPGGPFDEFSADLANALVATDPGATVLEFASAQARLSASEPVWIGLAGSGHTASLAGRPVPLGSRFLVPSGAMLEIEPVSIGFRCYVACPGGLSSLSDSAHQFAPNEERTFHQMVKVSFALPSLRGGPLRIVPCAGLDEETAVVTARIDRVGLRLQGQARRRGEQAGLSRPTVVGALQRTPDGELLVHGPDGPTVGGYDLLGVVARADLDRLAQLRPGDPVEFEPVELASARRLWEREATDRARLLGHVLNRADGS